MKKYIKLSEYAKNHAIVYKTAWNRFKEGKIPDAIKDVKGNILVEIKEEIENNFNKFSRR